MTEKNGADKSRKVDEKAEQKAAEVESMGKVAAAVPGGAGSAPAEHCQDSAPAHEGGEATLVAGEQAHQADRHIKKAAAVKKH